MFPSNFPNYSPPSSDLTVTKYCSPGVSRKNPSPNLPSSARSLFLSVTGNFYYFSRGPSLQFENLLQPPTHHECEGKKALCFNYSTRKPTTLPSLSLESQALSPGPQSPTMQTVPHYFHTAGGGLKQGVPMSHMYMRKVLL